MASPKYEVCPRCEGKGKIVHPALSVWTESDRSEDPDSFAQMLDGDYDVTCTECHGLRVVTEEDEAEYHERLSDTRTRLAESGIYPGHPDYGLE